MPEKSILNLHFIFWCYVVTNSEAITNERKCFITI